VLCLTDNITVYLYNSSLCIGALLGNLEGVHLPGLLREKYIWVPFLDPEAIKILSLGATWNFNFLILMFSHTFHLGIYHGNGKSHVQYSMHLQATCNRYNYYQVEKNTCQLQK